MARAFFYAGAQSLVSTRWNVSDQFACEMAERFYSGLKNGLDKDVALSKAINSFQNYRADRFSHPYYWASYQLTGSTEKVMENRYPLLLTILSMFGLLLIAFYVWRKLAG